MLRTACLVLLLLWLIGFAYQAYHGWLRSCHVGAGRRDWPDRPSAREELLNAVWRVRASPRCPVVLAGCAVEQTKLMTAIAKLVLAGERAGFTVEQMIQLLQTAPA